MTPVLRMLHGTEGSARPARGGREAPAPWGGGSGAARAVGPGGLTASRSSLTVIARLDRAIQPSSEYFPFWMPRSSRGMTAHLNRPVR